MKEKMLRSVMAILLIMTLTMANFILFGINVVSYAAEAMSLESKTSHKNVEFMTYFKDEAGNPVADMKAAMNANELKLYMKVAVKQEGYFNGKITLDTANFILKPEIISEGITKIEGNTITISQINAGESKEFEVGISIIKDEHYDLGLLKQVNKLSIQGNYQDSTQKDIKVIGTRTVSLQLTNPYHKDNIADVLKETIITNQVMTYEGVEKRIVQVEVEHGLHGNMYPVKMSKIELSAPKINDKYPEKVMIETPDVLVSTGKGISQDNWTYNNETGVIEITSENQAIENKVSWLKEGRDKYIITYVFPEKENIKQQTLTAKSEIYLYDENNTKASFSYELSNSTEEKNSIVTCQITQEQKEIYKGKLYAGIERDFVEQVDMQVNLESIADKVVIKEDHSKMNVQNVTTKETRFMLGKILEVLGTNGELSVLDQQSGVLLAHINASTQTDENGMVVITYPKGTKEVTIRTSAPVKVGKITWSHVKTIGNNSEQLIRGASEMTYGVSSHYVAEEVENTLQSTEATMKLLETETSAKLEMNKTELSTMKTNENVEFRAILQSKDEKNELYKNPMVKITLPEKIKTIDVKSIKLLYEDELTIKTAVLKGNTIEIQLEGEQTAYKEEAIEGATILIVADLTTNKKEATSTEVVRMSYTNQKAIHYAEGKTQGEDAKEIKIVSYAGLVTTHYIPEYDVQMINNEGTASGKLELGAKVKQATIKGEIVNNQGTKIEDVSIQGTFPTKDARKGNNISASVGNIQVQGIPSERITIYYSEKADATNDLTNKANGWTTTIANANNVKKYIIVIDALEINEEVSFSYPVEIPEGLDYNQEMGENYEVIYTNSETGVEQKITVNPITLTTGKGPVLETNLSAIIAGAEKQEVSQGEMIRYQVKAANTGSETISDMKIVAPIPSGTVALKENALSSGQFPILQAEEIEQGFEELPDEKQVEFAIDTLLPGETVTKYYDVRVKREATIGTVIKNQVTASYGEVQKVSNEVNTTIKAGVLQLELSSVDDTGVVQAGYTYRYMLKLTNLTDVDMRNIKIDSAVTNCKVKEISYNDANNNNVLVLGENGSISIPNLPAGQTLKIIIMTEAGIFNDSEVKQMTVMANATVNGNTYGANQKVIVSRSAKITMTNHSDNAGEYVKAGDKVVYNIKVTNAGQQEVVNVQVEDKLPQNLSFKSIAENGKVLAESAYQLEKNYDTSTGEAIRDGIKIKVKTSLQPGETKEYRIEAEVDYIQGNTESIELANVAKVYIDTVEFAKSEVKHILEPTSSGDNGNGDDDGGGGSENPGEETSGLRHISGVAWFDENEDGQKDENEMLLSGITVRLLNTKTNEFVKDSHGKEIVANTNNSGFYTLAKVPQGDYMVIFEYDTSKYILTSYEKEGVTSSNSSKAIHKTMEIDGIEKTVGATEVISVSDQNIANINVGFKEAKIFDLRLDKYIRKVIVQNSKGISTYEYDNATFAKAEIDAKLINGTTVVVEYSIQVTNEGEVDAYVKKIVDNLSSDFKFTSELNKDWYQDGGKLYSTSLANEKIAPGESKEIKLTVTKKMTENNTGLVPNTAEIDESYNEQGLLDKDSTAGNQVTGEDDMGSADLILSIKTGQIISVVTIILSTIVILSVGAYVITKMIVKRRIL